MQHGRGLLKLTSGGRALSHTLLKRQPTTKSKLKKQNSNMGKINTKGEKKTPQTIRILN